MRHILCLHPQSTVDSRNLCSPGTGTSIICRRLGESGTAQSKLAQPLSQRQVPDAHLPWPEQSCLQSRCETVMKVSTSYRTKLGGMHSPACCLLTGVTQVARVARATRVCAKPIARARVSAARDGTVMTGPRWLADAWTCITEPASSARR